MPLNTRLTNKVVGAGAGLDFDNVYDMVIRTIYFYQSTPPRTQFQDDVLRLDYFL